MRGSERPELGALNSPLNRPCPALFSFYPISKAERLLVNMSAQNSAGIQTLLDAEREAQKIVQKAREYRTQRIRDAKSEAQKEIEEYKNQKEEEYKKFEGEHSSGYKVAQEEADKEAEVKLQEIKDAGKKQGDKVVADLIRVTTDVKPEASEKIKA
ncbi:Vacuolar (H+)-ATPase G subunit [Penicillium coprophilum]|uniref:Vacuolar (H+)-ATPase G subunit n=1 Tax=Penicillium coprophilum TaxID=36646 RepID=UPI002387557D|nr:Vacuolar (H+)-ATPase G subunit [Penicillium coprophilum]KAJ5177418.1 Vacuolar (H+)-ATPase G subunit [Penicillium coprophilum]